METMDLAVLQNKLESSPPSHKELKKMAAETTRNILTKIHSCSESIAEAKEAAENANNMKAGWFGKTKKKVNAATEALVQTNEAVAEMSNVVQESIKFTCVSYAFAEIMRDTMQMMIANGFKDADGRIKRLNDNGREAAELVLQETESVAQRQKEQETRLSKLNEGIEQNRESITANTERIDEHDNLHEHARLSRQKMHIKDEEHDKLHEHARLSRQKMHIKDDEHDALLEQAKQERELLKDEVKRLEQRVGNLEKLSNKGLFVILIILTALSLSIGCISLFLHMIGK
jgi:DNA repair exonuclease SbcCD ATPase subunit